MKKLLVLSVAFLISLLCASVVSAEEKIDSYSVNLKINSDASISVTEQIEYDFGTADRHGIYRNVPVKYKARGGNFKLRISDVVVTDENGVPYNFTESQSGSDAVIKIGDADTLITGNHTYVINYVIRRAINYFDAHDELYWNAIGAQWEVPISNASATVVLPQTIESSGLQSTCYTGSYGSDVLCSEIKENQKEGKIESVSFSEDVINPGNGLTVVVGFPAGMVNKPTPAEIILETVKDNWIVFVPIVVLIALFYLWYTRGRDPKGRGTIVAQFEPPDNLSPLEIGTIVDERFDKIDISAEIVNLAVEGYIKIKRIEKKILLFNSTDYELKKLRSENSLSEEFQRELMRGLFGKKSSVKISELRNKFYKDLREIQKKVYRRVVEKEYFPSNPNTLRAIYFTFGIFVVILGPILGPLMGGLAIFSMIASGIMIVAFGFVMPKKTRKGAIAKEHIAGLTQYLEVAEKDRIKFHNAPKKNPELFEKLLPYAMVLKVEEEWAEQFENIYTQRPSWYEDPGNTTFSTVSFMDSLHSFSSSANSTLSSSPSSAAGGGSGFSGGGSGGGFGGGGGGSW